MLFFGATVITLSTSQSVSALTTIPTKMNYQGRLTTSGGVALADGNYNMRFRLYTTPAGGAAVWSSDRMVSASQGVTIKNGLFAIQLGSIVPLPASLFAGGTLYLEVELPTPASATSASPVWSEGPMTPRNQMASSAYAFNSETLDGLDSSDFAQIGSNNSYTGAQTFNGTSVSIGGAASATKFNVAGLFNVNTTGSSVSIGVPDATGTILALDTKTTAGDPTGTNGAMYYNASSAKFRCYQNGVWVDCVSPSGGTTSLQDAYNASSTPATISTTASKSVKIAAGASPSNNIFSVDTAGQAVSINNANGIGVTYGGGTGTIEGSGIRVDYTPGGTAGATWNGIKIAANPSGAAAGVTSYGLNVNGPTTQGPGMEVGLSIDANWDAGIQLGSKTGEPDNPPGDNIYVYASKYAGRSLLSQKSPSGVAFAYQPALFQNTVTMFSPNTSTSGSYIGGTWTIDTTASTPSPNNQALGFGTNFATAATVNDTAGTYQNIAQFVRGNLAGGANGFFNVSRIVLPDANYGSGSTGARVWIGMTSQTSGTMVQSDNPTGNYAGFSYNTNRNDVNWQFITKDNSTQNIIDTGVPLVTGKAYDFYVYTPPNGTTIYWRVDNLNDGVMQEGSTTNNLPINTTYLRGSAGISTLTTTARNIRVNKIYVEADR